MFQNKIGLYSAQKPSPFLIYSLPSDSKQVLCRTQTQTQLHLLIKNGHETVNRHLLHCLTLMGRDKAEMLF